MAENGIAVVFEPEKNRFVAHIEGQECVLLYSKGKKGEMVLTFTFVPPALRGKGIAEKLMQAAVEQARKNHCKIEPACSYTAVFFERHPEYKDLLS
jgi:uncharacterized protein